MMAQEWQGCSVRDAVARVGLQIEGCFVLAGALAHSNATLMLRRHHHRRPTVASTIHVAVNARAPR